MTPPRRPADLWREGWRYGFADALRLAGRELGPQSWATLDELADRYTADDYDIAS